jgi:hypothetical protein
MDAMTLNTMTLSIIDNQDNILTLSIKILRITTQDNYTEHNYFHSNVTQDNNINHNAYNGTRDKETQHTDHNNTKHNHYSVHVSVTVHPIMMSVMMNVFYAKLRYVEPRFAKSRNTLLCILTGASAHNAKTLFSVKKRTAQSLVQTHLKLKLTEDDSNIFGRCPSHGGSIFIIKLFFFIMTSFLTKVI